VSGMLVVMTPQNRTHATAPAPRHGPGTYRVCMVCLGNICRSPMAEAVFRGELTRAGLSGSVVVDSAGTGDWHVGERMDAGARTELSRRGYDGAGHRSRQFEPSWFGRYDLVAAMDEENLRRLQAMAPGTGDAARVILFTRFDPDRATVPGERDAGIPDPYGEGADDFALVFDMAYAAARGLAGQLSALLAGRSERSARAPAVTPD
jgi:protein-tyrosine phosphatase